MAIVDAARRFELSWSIERISSSTSWTAPDQDTGIRRCWTRKSRDWESGERGSMEGAKNVER